MDVKRRIAAALTLLAMLGMAVALRWPSSAGQVMPAQQSKSLPPDSVELTEAQAKAFELGLVGTHAFPIEREAVGSIDFNEDLAVQVFTPYPGRIIEAFARLGDDVRRGQVLFTIESPDLIAAENTLISAAGVRELNSVKLERARHAFTTGGIARNDLDQAVSDQMGADGAFKAARNSVRIFGKSDDEIDRIVRDRRIDPILVVASPIDGHISARNAAPGLYVQPGNNPAPYTVADISTKWMLANVVEADVPLFHPGQAVRVKVTAYPDRVFEGRISTVGTTIDPNTHRLLVRSEISDPAHELRPGMLASFVIQAGNPVEEAAVPVEAIVREGDGTMTAWTTDDGHVFSRRVIKAGLRDAGFAQITEGLKPGEPVVSKGAIFLSNMLAAAGS